MSSKKPAKPTIEFKFTDLFAATTDENGYVRIPELGLIAMWDGGLRVAFPASLTAGPYAEDWHLVVGDVKDNLELEIEGLVEFLMENLEPDYVRQGRLRDGSLQR